LCCTAHTRRQFKVFKVDVGVAVKRPPKTDCTGTSFLGRDGQAELLAINRLRYQCHAATESVVTDWEDPYVEEANANPERRNNGCQIYRVGSNG
jgi:hypothetical protein